MNHKNLLVLVLFVLQSFSSLHSSNQENWNKVFTALNGAYTRDRLSTSTANRLLSSLSSTAEGKIGIKYVSGASLSEADSKQYDTALIVFKNGGTPPVLGAQIGDAIAANWTAAIAAFGSAQDVYDKKSTLSRTLPTSTPASAINNAKVIVQYLNGTTMNATDSTNLQAAFTAAGVKTTPNTNETDTAAAGLKAQIEAAKLVYNQYKPGTYTPTA